jgi:HSP20 family protein
MRQQDEHGGHKDPAHTDIDRMYQDMLAPTRWVVMQQVHTWRPPTDVYETDEAVVVRVEVAGMKESDFVVSLQGRLLTVAGTRNDPCPKVAYHQMEVRYGEFRVEVYLHWAVDPEAITATYVDGFLQVKLHRAQPRKLHPVEAYKAP